MVSKDIPHGGSTRTDKLKYLLISGYSWNTYAKKADNVRMNKVKI